MIVKCIKNHASITKKSDTSSEEGWIQSVYQGVLVEKEYQVYGAILFLGTIFYLLYDERLMPCWYPAELFNVEDNKVPDDWYHSFSKKNDVQAVWGYRELVESDEHYDGLCEQEREHVDFFIQKIKGNDVKPKVL